MQAPQTPFHTNNGALAVALSLANVPHPQNDKGEIIPVYNIYDRNKLLNLGYSKWNIELAALDAVKRGKPGTLIYNFQRNELCERIKNAWEKQQEEANAADVEAGGELFSLPVGDIDIEPETFAKICYQFTKNRKHLMSIWQSVPPMVTITDTVRTEDDKTGAIITVGKIKAYSTNISPEARKRLGLPKAP